MHKSLLDIHDMAKVSTRDTEAEDAVNALRFRTKTWHGTTCVTMDGSSRCYLDVILSNVRLATIISQGIHVERPAVHNFKHGMLYVSLWMVHGHFHMPDRLCG